MGDENILAGMTTVEADADIAARQAKVDLLEKTLEIARDNLAAARNERKVMEPRPDGVDVVSGLGYAEWYEERARTARENVKAQAGAAEASGEVSS